MPELGPPLQPSSLHAWEPTALTGKDSVDNIAFRYRLPMAPMADILKDLFLGFVRVHILYHASQEPAYGTWLIEELAEHGYTLSPGTLYPILHGLEEEKLLSSYEEVINGKVRKYYKATADGRKVLKAAQKKVGELSREILPE
jgi:PadR family transcriptional regulator